MTDKTAEVYRMVMDDHLCPYGLKTKALLRRHGFHVNDHHLTTREQTENFKAEHDVTTTPQVWIDGQRIGGYDALRKHFGHDVSEDETTYRPVVAIFTTALAIAVAAHIATVGTVLSVQVFEWFVAISMTLLALQKLQDVESFSTMFLNYDLLARRWVGYGYLYPYGEAVAGVLMLAGTLIWIAAPIALVIGTGGAISVFKAVYVDRRELKCACVGGKSNVPLGFISLTENLMMMFMGIWMPLRTVWGWGWG